jgi:hypothetical protein
MVLPYMMMLHKACDAPISISDLSFSNKPQKIKKIYPPPGTLGMKYPLNFRGGGNENNFVRFGTPYYGVLFYSRVFAHSEI